MHWTLGTHTMSSSSSFPQTAGSLPEGGSETKVLRQLNVLRGASPERTVMSAHGSGCDQYIWGYVALRFEPESRATVEAIRAFV